MIALAILCGSRPLTLPAFLLAAAIAVSYFAAMLVAPLFPGTAWCDPEFAPTTPRPFGLGPQQLVSLVVCGATVIAIGLAVLG